ncbi:hypothetical protein JB92DRAFT_2933399 [Gautieria morchelliformis]|nr:hypothetical protein JB92DRAFT_2933399 [Gautieria morchelliformis]
MLASSPDFETRRLAHTPPALPLSPLFSPPTEYCSAREPPGARLLPLSTLSTNTLAPNMSNILRIPPRRTPTATSTIDLDMPQIMTINQLAAPSSEPDFEEDYITDDEEVDEIIDDEPPPVLHKLNGKGKGTAKATPNNLTPSVTPAPLEPQNPIPEPELPPLPSRKPGETHVDQQRVEKIIKAHGDLLPPSKDAVFLISLAAEEFVKRLAETGRRHAANDKREIIGQQDMALAAHADRGYSFLRETVPRAIPLSLALQKHTQKENERTLIATELVQPSPAIGNGTSAHSHKKRPPPLRASVYKGRKIRTSARQANGRSSAAASTSASAPVSAAGSPRPKRAAAQRGRGSWAQADEDVPDYEEEERSHPPPEGEPMDVDNELAHWKPPARQGYMTMGPGRGGIMKGFGPGAYAKVAGLGDSTRSGSPGLGGHATSPQRSSRGSWGFPPEPPR